MDLEQILKGLRADNPGVRFAVNSKKNAIGYWANGLGRWQVLLGKMINGVWDRLPDILVDGKPLIPQEDWKEVIGAA
jgi:hypothetical protein